MLKKIRFPAAAGHRMRAFLALPDGKGPHPAVIVLHEIGGLNDDIQGKAERFASMGYVALAPDMFDRPGRFRPLCIARTINDIRRGYGEAFDHLEAAHEWLGQRSDVDANRLGVAGFCLGGGFALLYAGRASLDAAAIFYGSVPHDETEYEKICPVIASYGTEDRSLKGHGERLREALDERGIVNDVKEYEGAGHSFMTEHSGVSGFAGGHSPMRVAFDPEAAEDAWERVRTFFAEHLRADHDAPTANG